MSNEIEQKAREMGWLPKEEFKGDDSRYVDAETYVKNGETVLPILRKENQKMHQLLQQQASETSQLKELLQAAQESIEELRNYQSEETKRQVKQTKESLLKELKQAKIDGNVEREVDITEALADIKVAETEVSKPAPKKEEKKTEPSYQLDPDMVAWADKNTWYGKDVRKTAKANGIANMLRADPDNDSLIGKAFYDKISELMNESSAPKTDKVEGGTRSSSTTASASAGQRGYKDLPPDAKAACDDPNRVAKLVGKGRAFKDVKAWQDHYAAIYFQGEE